MWYLAKNLAYFCLCPENVSEVDFKWRKFLERRDHSLAVPWLLSNCTYVGLQWKRAKGWAERYKKYTINWGGKSISELNTAAKVHDEKEAVVVKEKYPNGTTRKSTWRVRPHLSKAETCGNVLIVKGELKLRMQLKGSLFLQLSRIVFPQGQDKGCYDCGPRGPGYMSSYQQNSAALSCGISQGGVKDSVYWGGHESWSMVPESCCS